MSRYLILRLDGPMQAWGSHTFEDFRPSNLFPTRSGLLGLLGACLGIDRGDHAVSFPLFFVFHRVDFMLPGFHRVEPYANHPETAPVTCSPASSAVASGCRTPQCIRSSPPSSLLVFHNAAHAPARF